MSSIDYPSFLLGMSFGALLLFLYNQLGKKTTISSNEAIGRNEGVDSYEAVASQKPNDLSNEPKDDYLRILESMDQIKNNMEESVAHLKKDNQSPIQTIEKSEKYDGLFSGQ